MTAVAPPTVRPYPTVLRHFAATRGAEVCVLQASPLLGAWFGGLGQTTVSPSRLALMLAGSLALTAHVFVVNDWAGYHEDARDAQRGTVGPAGNGIGRGQVGRLAAGLLALAAVALALVGTAALLLGAGIAALGLVYSLSPRYGKSTPVAASLNHVVGGSLHFLLGYTLLHGADAKGVALSLFFGLVFSAGHLNQEVRDYDSDLAGAVSTSAVVFGRRHTFIASFGLFTVAYALIIGLAATGRLPQLLLLTAVVWLVHAAWTLEALRRGLQRETALWIQRRYRVLFALVGVVMLIR